MKNCLANVAFTAVLALHTCEEEHTSGDCFTRDCVKEKKLNFCGECKNFPCDTIMTKPHSTVLDKDWLAWKKKSERNR